MNSKDVIQRRMAELQTLGLNALKVKFRDLYGFEPGKTNTQNLRKRLAYRIQEIHLGGLSGEDREKLSAIADGDPLANLTGGAKTRYTVPGTRFSRLWKKQLYEAVANGDGSFEYNGENYTSLSAIARTITGTRWNGKLFFGVK